MAYTTGTAADATALFNALVTYLTTDTTLVGLGQNWTTVWTGSGAGAGDKILRGPGLSGGDQVYVGFRLQLTAPGDSYRLNIVGMSGIIPSATIYTDHINVSPVVGVMLDIAPMNYWFVASGRRFIFAAKMSTVYEIGYGGLFLPYGNPVAYPYPLMVGGTTRLDNTGEHIINTWRSTAGAHANFAHGPKDTTPALKNSPALVLDPLGQWSEVGGTPNTVANMALAPMSFGPAGGNWDIQSATTTNDVGYSTIRDNMAPCFDGTYALTPLTIIQPSPSQVYGVIDGVFFVPGQGNSSENLVTISAVNYLVVQNIFRTSTGEFVALRLE